MATQRQRVTLAGPDVSSLCRMGCETVGMPARASLGSSLDRLRRCLPKHPGSLCPEASIHESHRYLRFLWPCSYVDGRP